MLLELVAAMAVLAVAAVSAAAALQGHARNIQLLYEERAAWEAAAGRLELLEAEGFRDLREGSSDVAVDAAGWENLEDARCTLVVEPAGDGMRSVTVRVEWKGFRGGRRRVEARTMIGGRP